MSTFRIAGVIPARLGSTRLSRKVLRPIAGRPMVEWVWRAAAQSGLMGPVVVATDSEEVAAACRDRGIPSVITSPDCQSGSDRVREAALQIDADIYVNIQGDEPTLTPDFFPPLLALFDRPEVQVSTLAVRCPAEEIANPNAVKVVTALDGRALYFSRSTIPFDRDNCRGRDFAATARALPVIASTWEFTPIAKPRWNGSPPCRPPQSKRSSAWSSSAFSTTELTSTLLKLPVTPSAWIPRKIYCGRKRQ